MSEIKPIGVGDLVVVVRGHQCALDVYGGVPFVVTALVRNLHGGFTCPSCKQRDIAAHVAYGVHGHPRAAKGTFTGIPITWLKRIDPLSEPERAREEMEA